jgi:crotonobetainyl-CoA:carnitine CoA-transferase CaiB-like acyl-CoA transferase
VTSHVAEAPAHPFSGVTIVDFGNFYAMPYATAMAAALGARVIQLEDAGGDPYRVVFRSRGGDHQDDGRQGEPVGRPADARGASYRPEGRGRS